jgi:hypothetical protein
MRAVASTWALVWSISCPGKSMSGQVCSVGAETACACGLVDRAVGRMEVTSPAFASAATVRTLARPARLRARETRLPVGVCAQANGQPSFGRGTGLVDGRDLEPGEATHSWELDYARIRMRSIARQSTRTGPVSAWCVLTFPGGEGNGSPASFQHRVG